MTRTAEQLVRDVLSRALEAGLVRPRDGVPGGTGQDAAGVPARPNSDPQRFTAAELFPATREVTDYLAELLRTLLEAAR